MCDKTSHATKTGRGYVQCSCQSTRVWQRHRTIDWWRFVRWRCHLLTAALNVAPLSFCRMRGFVPRVDKHSLTEVKSSKYYNIFARDDAMFSQSATENCSPVASLASPQSVRKYSPISLTQLVINL